MIRFLAPRSRILAGGPAFSLFGARLMKEIPEIDCGLVGEGESALLQILAQPLNPGSVPGLIWRNGGRIERNPMGAHILMDLLPDMDLASFVPEDYAQKNKYVAAVGIEGKRGCDLHCSYCIYPFLGGGKMRLRSPEKIVDEMEHLNKAHGVDLFHFTDSVLNRPDDHFEATCREIMRRKLIVNWTGFFREDCLNQELMDLAARAGLVALYFSADALTDHGLKILNKQMFKENILRAARIAAKSKILTMCHFLINLPGETKEHAVEARQMLDQILDIHGSVGNLGAIIFNTVRLYPGAPLTRKLLKKGLLDSGIDLLYPVYYDPPESAHLLHELESHCHAAGVFSRLQIDYMMEKKRI